MNTLLMKKFTIYYNNIWLMFITYMFEVPKGSTSFLVNTEKIGGHMCQSYARK